MQKNRHLVLINIELIEYSFVIIILKRSIGVLIYKLVTLRSPFNSVNKYEEKKNNNTGELLKLMIKELEEKEYVFAPFRCLNEEAPEILKEIVKK